MRLPSEPGTQDDRREGLRRRRKGGSVREALVAMRPIEWTKNAFVLAPLVFSGRLDERDAVIDAGLAFIAFCAVASAGYLINDVRDAELDRSHPAKRNRPVASGRLGVRAAIAFAAFLAVAGLGVAAAGGAKVVVAVLAYFVLSAAYSIVLKRLVIIDVMTIAAGFLLRVWAGLAAVDNQRIGESEWLFICTGLLAMLLGFAKRRQEAASELHDGILTRPVLANYSLPFLDQMVSISAASVLLSYVLYTFDSRLIGNRMLPTAIPVIYGILRYLFVIYHQRDDRSTSVLLARDPGIISAGIAWIVLAAALLYL